MSNPDPWDNTSFDVAEFLASTFALFIVFGSTGIFVLMPLGVGFGAGVALVGVLSVACSLVLQVDTIEERERYLRDKQALAARQERERQLEDENYARFKASVLAQQEAEIRASEKADAEDREFEERVRADAARAVADIQSGREADLRPWTARLP